MIFVFVYFSFRRHGESRRGLLDQLPGKAGGFRSWCQGENREEEEEGKHHSFPTTFSSWALFPSLPPSWIPFVDCLPKTYSSQNPIFRFTLSVLIINYVASPFQADGADEPGADGGEKRVKPSKT